MHVKKTVAIVCIDGCGSEAWRQALESFGYFVVMYLVGRPQHFIEILSGKTIIPVDYIIIACHGDDNRIIMTELGEDIYFPDEPRGNFGFNEIDKYLSLKDTCIISTGCSTGNEVMAKSFVKNNNIYIAPTEDIYTGFIFVVLFFYYLCSEIHGFDIETAYKKASSIDSDTGSFVLRK